uniref:RNA silencing suppressor n=1 Tax=Potato rough dwarf virus TaxID=106118 RepID=Q9QBT8_9VIRU|nr:nucleotide binding protein [Potato rough dwarf virus]
MHNQEIKRLLSVILVCSKFGVLDINLCVRIARMATECRVGGGCSRYAKRRRAKSIGRCERCYRIFPPVCNSKCDNKTCRVGISPNSAVVNFIEFGVAEAIPKFWF